MLRHALHHASSASSPEGYMHSSTHQGASKRVWVLLVVGECCRDRGEEDEEKGSNGSYEHLAQSRERNWDGRGEQIARVRAKDRHSATVN